MRILILSVLFTILAFPVHSQETPERYRIDTRTTYQTIDNFSASDAWRCDFIGKNWPEEKRNRIADLLFLHEFDEKGNPKGMALTSWRVNIGAGSFENRENNEVRKTWNRTECFMSPDGTYDFSRQAGQQWFMNAARERGMNSFLFFTNSAPYFMTRSGSTLSPDQKSINIREDKFDDFAEFLVRCAEHFQAEGFNVDYISPINEPNGQWSTNPNQEGSFATKEDIYKVTRELDRAIGKSFIKSKIIIPEVGNMKFLFEFDPAENIPDDIINSFFTEDGRYSVLDMKNVYNCVAAHDYWSAYPPELLVGMRQKVDSTLKANGTDTRFWASEYCILEQNEDITMFRSPEKSISLGLYVARIIHNDLAVANASAWQWWTAVSLAEDVPIELKAMKGCNDESVKYDGIISPTKMLWATANYSFFIRPGMKRIDIRPVIERSDLEAATDIMCSAYTDGRQVIAVYINYSEEDRPVSIECGRISKGKIYITSVDKDLEYCGTKDLSDIVLPGRSIVSVVM